jgi:hypothetical protein
MSDNCELNGFKGALPVENDPLSLWRLAADLSVVDAAILIAGGDPSEIDRFHEDNPYMTEEHKWKKRTTKHPGFVPAFSALKAAVLDGQIATHFQYTATPYFEDMKFPIDKFHIVSREVLSEYLSAFYRPVENPNGKIAIFDEPDWAETFVKVDGLKSWLRSRGFTVGFFFNSDKAGPDEFMDKSHEHFAPELALAVEAWRALAEVQRFPRGPKAAIKEWIDANPDVWQGEDSLSNEAKMRIMTLVNWKRSGGANPTGG